MKSWIWAVIMAVIMLSAFGVIGHAINGVTHP